MGHLAGGYPQSQQVLEAGSRKSFFLLARFPLPIPNLQVFRFVAGLTGCGIDPLEDPGKAMVASVQQIASRDSEQPR